MSLFDSIAGAVLGKVMGGEQGGMAQVAMEMFNQNGGLNGILDKLSKVAWVMLLLHGLAKVKTYQFLQIKFPVY